MPMAHLPIVLRFIILFKDCASKAAAIQSSTTIHLPTRLKHKWYSIRLNSRWWWPAKITFSIHIIQQIVWTRAQILKTIIIAIVRMTKIILKTMGINMIQIITTSPMYLLSTLCWTYLILCSRHNINSQIMALIIETVKYWTLNLLYTNCF